MNMNMDILEILTTQLEIERKELSEDTDKINQARLLAKEICVFGTKDVFLPNPLIHGYYDKHYSMIISNQARDIKSKIGDLISSLAKAMIHEKSIYYLNIPKHKVDEVILSIKYFLHIIMNIKIPKISVSLDSLILGFGIIQNYLLERKI